MGDGLIIVGIRERCRDIAWCMCNINHINPTQKEQRMKNKNRKTRKRVKQNEK